jgi:hypothetical protein
VPEKGKNTFCRSRNSIEKVEIRFADREKVLKNVRRRSGIAVGGNTFCQSGTGVEKSENTFRRSRTSIEKSCG